MTKKITALTAQKRNRERINVYLDGEFAFGLSRIVAGWLTIGQDLSDEKIAQLQAEDEREVAFQQAIKFLSYRPRSEAEVSRNLVEHKYSDQVIQETLERLRRTSLVDDSQFAQVWVENRSEFRPRGRRMLTMELRQRGLNDEDIHQAIQDIDEDALAYEAAQKHARKLHNLDWMQFRQKLSGFLLRRGFNYETITPVVKRVWEETYPSEGLEDDELI